MPLPLQAGHVVGLLESSNENIFWLMVPRALHRAQGILVTPPHSIHNFKSLRCSLAMKASTFGVASAAASSKAPTANPATSLDVMLSISTPPKGAQSRRAQARREGLVRRSSATSNPRTRYPVPIPGLPYIHSILSLSLPHADGLSP